MVIAQRLRGLMADREISQSELARRVGVRQPTIFKLASGGRGSIYLHKIARELGTTPAYLTGETDDPDEGAPPASPLDSEARELIESFADLAPADRRALLQIARSMKGNKSAGDSVQAPTSPYREGDAR